MTPSRSERLDIASGQARARLYEGYGRPERLRQLLLLGGCFLLSWHNLRLGNLNFSLSDFLFLLCFFILLVRQRLNLMAMQSLTALWILALSMMLGGLLIGSIFNGDPLRWSNIASQYLFGFLMLPMVFMSEDRFWIRKCLLYFVFGVAASQLVALGAANLLGYGEALTIFGPTVATGNGRIGGLVADANLNGAVIGVALIALMNANHHRLIGVAPTLGVGSILLWALLSTASFTAFASAGIATIVYFVVSDFGKFLRVGVPLLLLFAAYIAFDFPLPEAFSERVLGAVLTGDLNQAGTFTHRSALIAEAWKMSEDTLFVGLGVDRFRVESTYGMPVHNFWMLLLTEGGLLSLAGLAAMTLILGIMGLKAMTLIREDAAMTLAMLTIFLVFTTSIPHMYNRLWIVPVSLALATAFARDHAHGPDLSEDDSGGEEPDEAFADPAWESRPA